MYNIEELEANNLTELKRIAKEIGLKKLDSYKKENRQDLIYAIIDAQAVKSSKPETSTPQQSVISSIVEKGKEFFKPKAQKENQTEENGNQQQNNAANQMNNTLCGNFHKYSKKRIGEKL